MDRVRIYIQEAPTGEAAQALLHLRAQLTAREVAAAIVPLAPGELPAEAAAAEFLAAVGAEALPLTLVDGEAVVSMRLPAFGELAFWRLRRGGAGMFPGSRVRGVRRMRREAGRMPGVQRGARMSGTPPRHGSRVKSLGRGV